MADSAPGEKLDTPRAFATLGSACVPRAGERVLAIADFPCTLKHLLSAKVKGSLLMPGRAIREIVDLCHKHDVLISRGGFIERVLAQGGEAVRQYVQGMTKHE